MDPSLSFCPNFYCLKRGLVGQGNIAVHPQKERRFRCTCCGKPFAASANTPYYRLHKPTELMTVVLTLLCHGCPPRAIVAAYGLDERTVAAWQHKAGTAAVPLLEVLNMVGQRFVAEVPVNFAIANAKGGTTQRADQRLSAADFGSNSIR